MPLPSDVTPATTSTTSITSINSIPSITYTTYITSTTSITSITSTTSTTSTTSITTPVAFRGGGVDMADICIRVLKKQREAASSSYHENTPGPLVPHTSESASD
ncbi:hypothetical protein NHX12_011011 [Muraenolepis orangiensis]|uniref:Uncharacterized protein n=1 Tax=Muraenolepis orangiensis TaxID=630683 RepID=A0A9Q0DFE4_9TELE|nr:hypothetical protein NHX12_011011 [Muraenolepis orangiensis]